MQSTNLKMSDLVGWTATSVATQPFGEQPLTSLTLSAPDGREATVWFTKGPGDPRPGVPLVVSRATTPPSEVTLNDVIGAEVTHYSDPQEDEGAACYLYFRKSLATTIRVFFCQEPRGIQPAGYAWITQAEPLSLENLAGSKVVGIVNRPYGLDPAGYTGLELAAPDGLTAVVWFAVGAQPDSPPGVPLVGEGRALEEMIGAEVWDVGDPHKDDETMARYLYASRPMEPGAHIYFSRSDSRPIPAGYAQIEVIKPAGITSPPAGHTRTESFSSPVEDGEDEELPDIRDLISDFVDEGGEATVHVQDGQGGALFADGRGFIAWGDLGYNDEWGFYRISAYPETENQSQYAPWSIHPVLDSDRDGGDVMFALLNHDGYGFLLGERWQVVEALEALRRFVEEGKVGEPVNDEVTGAKYLSISEACQMAYDCDPQRYPYRTPEERLRLSRRIQRAIQRGNVWGVYQDPQGHYRIRAAAFRGWLVQQAEKSAS